MNLNLTEFTTKVTPGKPYMCFVDVCREGIQFCNVKTQRCGKCSDYLNACFSGQHQNNCSQYCLDQYQQNNEQKSNEDTTFKWLFIGMVIVYIVTVTCMIILYLYLRVHKRPAAMRYLSIRRNADSKNKTGCRELDLLSFEDADNTSLGRSRIRDETISLNGTEHNYDDVECHNEQERGNTLLAEDVPSETSVLIRSLCNVRNNEPAFQNQNSFGGLTTRKEIVDSPILSTIETLSNQTATQKLPYSQAVSSVSSECRINGAARNDKPDQVATQQSAAHTKVTENSKYENDCNKSEMNRSSTSQSKQSNDITSVKGIEETRSHEEFPDLSNISENPEEERTNISRQQNERPVLYDNTTYREQAHTHPFPSCHNTDPHKDKCSHLLNSIFDDKNEPEYDKPVKQATENGDNTRPKQHHTGRVPGHELSGSSCYDIESTQTQIDGNTRRKELDVAGHHHQCRYPERELSSCNSDGLEGLPDLNSGQSDKTTGYHTQDSQEQ